MKIWPFIFSAVFAVSLALTGPPAEAKRMGGGGSFGKQSSNVTQRQAPANGANQAAKPATPGATPAAAAPKKPWGAMLGGLAAGLGLAWLASSLGLSGAFGQIIMFALLAFVLMAVIGFVMRRLKGNNGMAPGASRSQPPFAFQGAGNAAEATAPHNYSPANVGNDASARPFERQATQFDAGAAGAAGAGGSMIGSALGGSQS